MATRDCWKCGVRTHQTRTGEVQRQRDSRIFQAPFTCDGCGAMSVAIRDFVTGESLEISNVRTLLENSADVSWQPKLVAGATYSDVPDDIASAAHEAHQCFSIGAFRAAILMARAVVEATAKDKGIKNGTLADKIDKLEEQQFVRPLIKDAAHEIRFIGNDMAHGDFADPVSEVEADDVLAFMSEVLNEVYQAPARVNARREARLAAKAAAQH